VCECVRVWAVGRVLRSTLGLGSGRVALTNDPPQTFPHHRTSTLRPHTNLTPFSNACVSTTQELAHAKGRLDEETPLHLACAEVRFSFLAAAAIVFLYWWPAGIDRSIGVIFGRWMGTTLS